MKQFGVQIKSKNGSHFRNYTQDTLQMLFDTSPSAANFELIIVIEGLIFMAIRSFYLLINKEAEYSKYIANKNGASFYNAIEKIYKLGIIDETLRKDLHKFRELRNDIAHDLFQLKTVYTEGAPQFKDYPYENSLRDLFESGLKVFVDLGQVVTPGHPSKEEYIKRFTGAYKRGD